MSLSQRVRSFWKRLGGKALSACQLLLLLLVVCLCNKAKAIGETESGGGSAGDQQTSLVQAFQQQVESAGGKDDHRPHGISSIDIRQVHVGGLIGRRIDLTVKNNLLALDIDKDFVQPFRDRRQKSGYIGAGKLLDALVRFAAYTRDEQVLALKRRTINEFIKTQDADGYIGQMVPESRMWKLWDIHETSYLVLGLATDHKYFGEEKSLDAARKLADYIIRRWTAEPEKKPDDGMLSDHMAVTGIGPAMLALYQETGDARYLDFCTKWLNIPDWEYPIVIGRYGRIGGHIYAYLTRCLAQLRIYRLAPDEKLLNQSHKAFDFLTTDDGLVVTGGCGDHECWHDSQAGTHNLAETCATAYLIRWLDSLLRLEGEPLYGDIMERTIYNALFAAQSPDGRKIRYYTPFDGPRHYLEGDTYCCPCNYRRIIAELPRMVFYQTEDGVMVNLFTPATATIELPGGTKVAIRQETDYPNSGKVLLHVSPSQPVAFSLQVRIPGWCPKAKVSVNGRDPTEVRPGFHTIDRKWKADDRVEIDMPMPWRLVKGRKAQAGRVAILRGPVLFCLNRARHPELKDLDLRLLTLDPTSLAGPIKDDTVRPEGRACQVRAWGPGQWYPFIAPSLQLTLTEYPDPGGEAVYFHVPNPKAKQFVDDQLLRR